MERAIRLIRQVNRVAHRFLKRMSTHRFPKRMSGHRFPKRMSIHRQPQNLSLPVLSHEDYVENRIKNDRLPSGFIGISSRKYILRPEAIESAFIMFRLTGDNYWRERGWEMFQA